MKEANERLLMQLRAEVSDIDALRGSMTVVERLTYEAYDCARRGDFDDARHRLRLRDQPKWSSEKVCAAEYKKTMAEQRGVSA